MKNEATYRAYVCPGEQVQSKKQKENFFVTKLNPGREPAALFHSNKTKKKQ